MANNIIIPIIPIIIAIIPLQLVSLKELLFDDAHPIDELLFNVEIGCGDVDTVRCGGYEDVDIPNCSHMPFSTFRFSLYLLFLKSHSKSKVSIILMASHACFKADFIIIIF